MGNCGGSKTWRLGLEQVCSLHSEPAPVWSERPVSPCASRSTTEGHLVCINWQTTCFDQMVNDTLRMRKVGLCMCKNVKSNYNLKKSLNISIQDSLSDITLAFLLHMIHLTKHKEGNSNLKMRTNVALMTLCIRFWIPFNLSKLQSESLSWSWVSLEW